ncbi:D-3-phosphoglycerate dehydrogenase [Kineosphaera limosa NBRC 100340]|uniref:D-3-phosphoglycerate dehydrogenase n=2 Tax=Kineosphaera TaxID=211469 RepID=K6W7K7_9MICO|nr:D-3-phosphoglycerate dehydrogenase [Kineosphaera limosa NBRC 100340]
MWDMKALLLENIHHLAETVFNNAGIEVEMRPGALAEDDLIEALDGVDLLGIRSTTQVTKRVLDASPHLSAIGCFCIGTNQVDLTAAVDLGIPVFNAPFSNTRSVVELVLAEIIVLARRLTEKDRQLHAGEWNKSAAGSHEIRGRKLGIVGYGNIGSQLSVVAEMLGMEVYFYDTDDKLALGNAKRCASLEELLDVAECVTLHVDGRAGNAGLFGAREFGRMRDRALFLNLSRGFLVDYEALATALESGHIAGAAVDVFPNEPKTRVGDFASPLQNLPNVILTPHVGGSTMEAQEDIGRFVAAKLRDYTHLGTTTLSVNAPELTLAFAPGHHRITYFHTNTPGVLASLNNILADHGANIDGQLLGTRGQIGYVVTDASMAMPQDVVAAIEALPETIRLRLIG